MTFGSVFATLAGISPLLLQLLVPIVQKVETLSGQTYHVTGQKPTGADKLQAAIGLAKIGGVVAQVADPKDAQKIAAVTDSLEPAVASIVAVLNAAGVFPKPKDGGPAVPATPQS